MKLVTLTARDGESLARSRCAVLGFGLDKGQFALPHIFQAVGYGYLVSAAHCRRGSNRVRARAVGDVGFDPDHHSRAIGGRRNTGEGDLRLI